MTAPDIVTPKDLYEAMEKLDAKIDLIIKDNNEFKVSCEGRFSKLETKMGLIYMILCGVVIAVAGVIVDNIFL